MPPPSPVPPMPLVSAEPDAGGISPLGLKIVIAGGFAVGKTTFVGAVSEITPLSTEAEMTAVSTGVDDLTHTGNKSTTTVALDFGRITFDAEPPEQSMVVYLFGTPGQERFFFAWDEVTIGAIGAIVLVDTQRLPDSFAAVGYFEQHGIPFAVAVNQFDHAHRYTTQEVRDALSLPAEVPVLTCDARRTPSAVSVLITLVEYALTRAQNLETPSWPTTPPS